MQALDTRLTQEFLAQVPTSWNGERDDYLICCRTQQETHDVKSFFFRAPEPRLFRFSPGQYITLELEIDGDRINRCYTISSAPTRPDTISITVKRVPGGKVSNWLHDNLRVGDSVRALGPAGDFTCVNKPAKKYLFLSGGSGITPLMSMARAFYEFGDDQDIVFVHAARTPNDIIFKRELEMMASHMQKFRTAFVCENRGKQPEWSGYTGYLSPASLQLIAPDFREREVFTCGPGPFMKAVKEMLAQSEFDLSHYHQESFSFEEAASTNAEPPAVPAATAAQAQFTIDFAKSRRTVNCDSQTNILDAARANGLRLPASCAQGMCGTCKCKLASGKVDMVHKGGIRQREIDQGFILICCSKPLTDLVIEK
ncbi:MAG: hybrid-cluster NAD(P)-dependent oxidoreductase [Gammaproteobacteria bacterium]|nr:hybrid-cluster NAD(P)-dependent oxidoreductase [Gammaproteobacteria bacterium]